MPVLIQNINANIIDNLKDTTSMFRLVKGSFGYGDWFEIGYYEAYLQNLMKVIGSEDLNKTRDFGLSYNRDSEFKVVEVSEVSLAIPCTPPTVINGTYNLFDEGGGQATFNLAAREPLVAPFDYTIATFEWYEDAALTIPIVTTSAYVTTTTVVYVKVITNPGCFSTATIQLNVI
jgi:hypothetical protein